MTKNMETNPQSEVYLSTAKQENESYSGFVVYPTYRVSEEKAYVLLFGRLKNGESFATINYRRPYFFIKTKDVEKAKKLISIDYENTKLKDFDEEPVTKATCSNPKDVPDIRKTLNDANISCYEADIRFAMRFLIDNDLKGHIEINGEALKEKTQIEKKIEEIPELKRILTGLRVENIFVEPEITPTTKEDEKYKLPNLKALSFDIETDMKTTSIFSVSIYCRGYDGENEKEEKKLQTKKVFIVKDNGIKYNNAQSVKDERTLLEMFKETVLLLDPDIILGWNVIDFDLNVLKEKFAKYNIAFKFGRDDSESKLKLTESFFDSSSADFSGRMVLDGITLMKTSFVKLVDYKLNTAAKVFLSEEKIFSSDSRHEEIEEAYEKDPQKLIDYNLNDARFALEIVEKSGVLSLTILRSMMTRMQLDRVKSSIASFDSLYLKELQKKGYVAPSTNPTDRDERIKGGYVRDSKPGIYSNIIVLDFKSLYPSIIRTFNIDPLSYVPSTKLDNFDKSELVKAPNNAYFKNEEGILPLLLDDLWSKRDEAKKNKDKLTSNAVKILMNSFFGILANPNCRFYSIDIGNAITNFGQELIKLTAEKIKEKGYEVIYGDSVTKDTIIIIQDQNGQIHHKKISELFFSVERTSGEKEYSSCKKIKVLTLDAKGKSCFKPIKYVMRHKTNKKVFRTYFTNYQYIETTEDHSLIGYVNKQKNSKLTELDRLVETKPLDIGKQTKSIVSLKLIPGATRKKTSNTKHPKELYEFMGLFVGDGSFNSGIDKKNYYLYIAGGKDTAEIVKDVILPLKKNGYIKNYWLKKKGDICVNGQKLINIINENFRAGVDGKQTKKIPEYLFNESEENISSFIRGLFSADGTVIMRNDKPIIRFTNTDDEIIKKTSTLLYRVGISNSIFRENKKNSYLGKESNTFSKHIYIKSQKLYKEKIGFVLKRKNSLLRHISQDGLHKRTIDKYDFDLARVVKQQEIEYSDYVYDIEVEDTHRFFANNVLVHNTDSLFIDAGLEDSAIAENVGKKLALDINTFFAQYISIKYRRRSYMELQFEKVYKRFLMPHVRGSDTGAKKRYAGILSKDGKDQMDFVGLEFVRSDWTDIAKKFQLDILTRIFNKEDISEYVEIFVKDLRQGKYDELLVYRKSIRKTVDSYTKTTPPHIKAARKIGRNKVGKIEYVMTIDGPESVDEIKHKIDYEHYIDKQIKPIADAVLVFFNKKFDDLNKEKKQKSLFDF